MNLLHCSAPRRRRVVCPQPLVLLLLHAPPKVLRQRLRFITCISIDQLFNSSRKVHRHLNHVNNNTTTEQHSAAAAKKTATTTAKRILVRLGISRLFTDPINLSSNRLSPLATLHNNPVAHTRARSEAQRRNGRRGGWSRSRQSGLNISSDFVCCNAVTCTYNAFVAQQRTGREREGDNLEHLGNVQILLALGVIKCDFVGPVVRSFGGAAAVA